MKNVLLVVALVIGLIGIAFVVSCAQSDEPEAGAGSGTAAGQSDAAEQADAAEQSGAAGQASVADSAETATPVVDYESAVPEMFVTQCAKCHSSARPAGHLDLESPGVAGRLVGVRSPEAEEFAYVAPGAPDLSYVLMKVRGAEGIKGKRMPPGAKALEETAVALLEAWILSLAPADTTSEAVPSSE